MNEKLLSDLKRIKSEIDWAYSEIKEQMEKEAHNVEKELADALKNAGLVDYEKPERPDCPRKPDDTPTCKIVEFMEGAPVFWPFFIGAIVLGGVIGVWAAFAGIMISVVVMGGLFFWITYKRWEKLKAKSKAEYEKQEAKYKKKYAEYEQRLRQYEKDLELYEKGRENIKREIAIREEFIEQAEKDRERIIADVMEQLEPKINAIGIGYPRKYYDEIDDIIELVEDGRAESLKEALNTYESVKIEKERLQVEQQRLEETQSAREEAERREEERQRREEEREWERQQREKEREQERREKEEREKAELRQQIDNQCSSCKNYGYCHRVKTANCVGYVSRWN